MAFPALPDLYVFFGPFLFVEIEYEFDGLKIILVFIIHLLHVRVYVEVIQHIT